LGYGGSVGHDFLPAIALPEAAATLPAGMPSAKPIAAWQAGEAIASAGGLVGNQHTKVCSPKPILVEQVLTCWKTS